MSETNLPPFFPSMVQQGVELRHWFHAHPELGFEEEKTHAKILSTLTSAGLEEDAITVMAKTCIVADIVGKLSTSGGGEEEGKKQTIIALRADMDGLPITERANAEELEYVSTHTGKMHACGHDGHMASLLTLALAFLSPDGPQLVNLLPDHITLRLLFQAAEERPGGALPMVQQGALDGVSAVYGFHNWPLAPLGSVRVKPGPFMAHVSEVDIRINGSGGHGSQPHNTVDAVLAASAVVQGLHSIVARNVPADSPAVISVGAIHGGTAYNILPDYVDLKATVRDFDPAVFDLIEKRIVKVATSIAEGYGASADVEVRSLYPAVINWEEPAQIVKDVGIALMGPEAVSAEGLPTMAAEDFSYFIADVPGCFFFLGGGGLHGLHTDRMNFADGIIPIAASMFLGIINRVCNLDLPLQ